MLDVVSRLEENIDSAMIVDRHRARRVLRAIRRAMQAGKPTSELLHRLQRLLDASIRRCQNRRDRLPAFDYDAALPITSARDEIAAAIRDNPVVVVCGETGSGKSTQLPKICLELGRGVSGVIGHTQPRRVAARSVASRIAQELGSSLGEYVGFKIRFTDSTSERTYIKLMTDGILLAETQQDRFLEAYDTIIVDEAHERSLNIDFLLGYLHRLLPKRPDLRLIITSATIDAERFAQHFHGSRGPAPVIEVSGRTYPVEVRYRPPTDEQQEEGEIETARCVADAVEEVIGEGAGDVLVFLPTERDIRDVAKVLRGRFRSLSGRAPELLPLYARLSIAEQNKVFQPQSHRRIVLATNVAESSLTVPNIRYVVDTGTARISRYAPRSKIQRLPVEAVSRASADQRMGRCGRIGPGICLRLYGEDDYLNRDRYTTPEIRRTNLAAVILRTLANKLGRIDEFPFLDPPRPEAVRDGHRTLVEIGAIDQHWSLTNAGRQLANLPVDPRIGRMILAAVEENCLREVLIIAAGLEVQDPRERPHEQREAADRAHAALAHPDSDFLSYLALWDFYHQLKSQLSRNQLQKACRQQFLSVNRLREWQEVHRQLVRLVEQEGMKQAPRRDDEEAIHRSLLAGLLSNIAMRGDRHQYQGAGGAAFYLWPGSTAFQKNPAWIVAAELVETSRRYLRTVGRINPAWIEPLAQHLVKRSYGDPHWSRKRGTVLAQEKVTLFGLTIVSGRRVPYGPIDAKTAREIFIREALVAGQFNSRAKFYAHNRQLLQSLQSLGAKARRREYVIDDWTQQAFYEARLPDDVYDAQTLQSWLTGLPSAEKPPLFMTQEDFLPGNVARLDDSAFPEQLAVDEVKYQIDYRFEPGARADGVTLTLPRESFNQLKAEQLGWLVPGLLEEKIVALIRALPKSIRRSLVPAPDTAKKALSLLKYGQGDFLTALAKLLTQLAEEPVRVEDFDVERLPTHLKMNLRVVDEAGRGLAEGRDLTELRRELGISPQTQQATIEDDQWKKDGITTWEFGDLPRRIDLPRGAYLVAAYPAVVDQGQAAGLRLFDNAEEAERQTRQGLLRLFCLAERRELLSQVKWFPDLNKLELYAAPLRHPSKLADQLLELIAARAFLPRGKAPRTELEYLEAVKQGRRRIPEAVQDVARVVGPMMNTLHEVQVRLEEKANVAAWREALQDIRGQLQELFSEGFLTSTPWTWLEQFPRYLAAILRRLEKLGDARGARDGDSMQLLREYWDRYRQRREKHLAEGTCDPELETFRWMLEEYRVSLLAQTLGTSIKVSPQRLENQWSKARS